MQELSLLNLEEIKKILPHRYPFLLLDRVLELEEGKSCKAIKNITGNEYFFQGHFPGNPMMPGVLIVEAMAKAAGIAAFSSEAKRGERWALFAGIDKARFKSPVTPGDQLLIETEYITHKMSLWKFRGRATVDGRLAAQAEIRVAVVDRFPSS